MSTKRILFVLATGVLGLVTACGGGYKAAQAPASHAPASHAPASHAPAVTHSSPAKHKSSGIPQDNGGDHDGDNSGGPSDGDGNI
jgi:hypothetical protein